MLCLPDTPNYCPTPSTMQSRPDDLVEDLIHSNYSDQNYLKARLRESCEKRFSKFKPRDWQLDIACDMVQGKSGILLAGTGQGKSLPFILPGLITAKTALVLSPLNALEEDQVRSFRYFLHFGLESILTGIEIFYIGVSHIGIEFHQLKQDHTRGIIAFFNHCMVSDPLMYVRKSKTENMRLFLLHRNWY